MISKLDIEKRNEIAKGQPKFSPGTAWETIWRTAKEFPFKGLIDIEISNESNFVVLSLNDDAMAIQYFWTGGEITEPKSFSIWSKLAGHAQHIVDVGAYTGYYSLAAATISKANITAYEPVSFIYARLSANVMLNNLSKIKFVNAAVSQNNNEVASIGINFGPAIFTSGAKLIPEGENRRMIMQPTRCVTLDAEHINDPVDLIKIDVEGAEVDVLEGAIQLLNQRHPVLLLETRPSTHEKVVSLLSHLNYEVEFIESASGADNYLCWHKSSNLLSVVKSL